MVLSTFNYILTRSCIFLTVIEPLNPFPKKPGFLLVYSTSLLKILWEKEKLLVMSNFSFFHSVFYPFGVVSAIFIKFKIVVRNSFSLEESKIRSLGKG